MSEDQELVSKYIEEDSYLTAASYARIAGYGVPVWALIGYLRVVDGDMARVAGDYDVPEDAMRAALLYYARHQVEIDGHLAANAAP